MKRLLTTLIFCAAGAGLIGSGCGVKEYVNCRSICEKKKECGTDSSFDIDNCASNCSNKANGDSNYARMVDTCKECADPLSCTDPKLIPCLAECPSLS